MALIASSKSASRELNGRRSFCDHSCKCIYVQGVSFLVPDMMSNTESTLTMSIDSKCIQYLDLGFANVLNVIRSPRCGNIVLEFVLFGNIYILSVKDPCDLLEAISPCLRKCEIYHKTPASENKHVQQVIFPVDSFECDGVDKNIEENGYSRRDPHHRKATRAQAVLPDLNGIRGHQRCESQGEAAIHKKEERNNGSPNRRGSPTGKGCGKCSDQNIRDEHATGGREKEETTPDTIDVERTGESANKIPDLQEAIDKSLLGCRRDADSGEHWWQIVSGDVLAGPLVKDSQEDGDKCSPAVGRRGDHITV